MKTRSGRSSSQCYSGGVGVGTGEAFSTDGFGATGEGTASGTTLRVGSGKAGALRFVLEFSFAFTLAVGLTSVTTSGETSAFAFAFTFAFALTLPPAGIPSSPLPDGDGPGCTG